MNREEALGYLAGIIDGEGCIAYYPNSETYAGREVQIANTDKDIVKHVERCLEVLGIDCNIRVQHYPNKKSCYEIHITHRDNLLFIHDCVPLASQTKKDKLYAAVSSYKRKFRTGKKSTTRPEDW